MSQTIKKSFPDVSIGMVHQTGCVLGAWSRGVEVILHLRNGVPRSAEVFDAATQGEDQYANVGLFIENGKLVDYDGVFELPQQVLDMVLELGIKNGLGI